MDTFEDKRDGKGTKEWSDYSYNICLGCEHACLYCYARATLCWGMAEYRTPGAWANQRLNPNRRLGFEVGRRGVVMFPTSHDITPKFMPEALATIQNLLKHNKVLVVSKPHLAVVKKLCGELADAKKDVLFRFTIGSLDRELCAFWEPGAPPPHERVAALNHAFKTGYATSVSCEPMLDDNAGMIRLVERVTPYVTDTIWLGKMNRCPQKYNAHIPGFATALAKIKAQQTDNQILKLAGALKGQPKVRWKDSIKAVLANHGKADES